MTLRPCRPSPSPRVRRLRADGDVAAWWEDVAAAGGPLVEAADDPAWRWVTFAWRGGEPVVLPLLNGVVDADRHASADVSPHVMDAVPGTDVRYVTYRLPSDLRASYLLYVGETVPGCDNKSWLEAVAAAVPDPWNRHECAGAFGHRASLLELADAPPMPYAVARQGAPRGTVQQRWHDGRRVWVYLPSGHDRGGPYPVAVFLDGGIWVREAPLAPTLDNLIAQGRIPPLVGVMVDVIDMPSRHRDLAFHEPFVDWLRGLLAFTGQRFGTTDEAAKTVIAGQSLGGLAAAYAGLIAGDRFGNALCQSGSFQWPQDDPFRLTRMFEAADSVPVRFFLQSGRHEWQLLPSLDRMCEVLDAKGVRYIRNDFTGGHDRPCWLQGLAEGLIALTRPWS